MRVCWIAHCPLLSRHSAVVIMLCWCKLSSRFAFRRAATSARVELARRGGAPDRLPLRGHVAHRSSDCSCGRPQVLVAAFAVFSPHQNLHSQSFIAICARSTLLPPHMKLNLQRSKLPTAGFLSRRVTEGLVSVSLAVLLAGGPTPAALALTPSTWLAGGGRFLDGEAGLMFDEATKARMMEKAKAAKEKVARAHL